MTKRALIPFLFLAIVAGMAGCKNSSTTPTPAPTVSPSPSPTAVAYLPLAINNAWNYTCGNGITATRVITAGTPISGITATTFVDTNILNMTPPLAIAQSEATDATGNTLIYQWSLPGTTTTTLVNPPGLEYASSPTAGQTATYAGPIQGNQTMTYMGPQAAITNAAGTWPTVVMFQFTNSIAGPGPAHQDFMVKGTGPVRIVFPGTTPPLPLTCDLATFRLN